MKGGIILDSESVLAEMTESDRYSEADTEAVEGLGAEEINDALVDAADDAFWANYDSVRSDAIAYLIRKAANR